MNEPITRDESRRVSASLQMPQQVPPVDRTSTRPTGAHGDQSGVEADGFLDEWGPRIARGIGG
ncbi:hypothetical protein, partial [Streptomyces chartreusis]